jgi:hypothetical protein
VYMLCLFSCDRIFVSTRNLLCEIWAYMRSIPEFKIFESPEKNL